MKWQRIALMLTILSLLGVPLAWSQGGNAEQQINDVTVQVYAALLKADANSLGKLLADDYTAIRNGGILFTKAQEIENLKSGALKYETFDIQDLKIHVYGHTAVTTALVPTKGTINGNPYSNTNRTTRVWVKQNGTWKCVSYQVTRVSQ
jgi:ketosteroid isomerase-like protein